MFSVKQHSWRAASRLCLSIGYPIHTTVWQQRCALHLSRTVYNSKLIEPILPQQSEQDNFEEMMEDRTNALLKTLGYDKSFIKKLIVEKKDDKSSDGGTTLSSEKLVPLVAAVDPNSPPVNTNRQQSGHFFDTQEVYSELRSAGLTAGQAAVIMRTMLELIDDLVQTTKHHSVPISAGANEAYLFDAASSEVRNEIQNSRQIQATAYRSGLARLQRDVEILEHEATEITSLLKSDLDIEVHERKNSARVEENVIQLKIQDLNNKIATRLNSELKSEIENLRWQITRRSLAAIAVITASIIWLTQTSSNTKTAKNQVRQRQTSTLKESPTVAVPILSPSVVGEPESIDHSVLQLDDFTSSSTATGESSLSSANGRGSMKGNSSIEDDHHQGVRSRGFSQSDEQDDEHRNTEEHESGKASSTYTASTTNDNDQN